MKKTENALQQIQLEMPDYSREYYEYKKKLEKQASKEQQRVIIIDI